MSAIKCSRNTGCHSHLDLLVRPLLHFRILRQVVDCDAQHGGDGHHAVQEELEKKLNQFKNVAD